nr:response regulator transcription factor [Anaerobium acetethylicum]
MKKILLVDDEMAIKNLLEVVLRKEQFTDILKASTGLEAVEICRNEDPDIIILDIMLPDIDGFEVCRRIREFSIAPVLFLSAKSEEVDKLVSFAIGGDDYITKPFSPKEVVAHVKAMIRRISYYEGKCSKKENGIRFGKYMLDFDKQELFKNQSPVQLTAKEYLLLSYLIENRNITISKEQIVQQVWGNAYEGYDNTVMVHVRHLREKIEEDPSNPAFLKTIKGRGYRFEL